MRIDFAVATTGEVLRSSDTEQTGGVPRIGELVVLERDAIGLVTGVEWYLPSNALGTNGGVRVLLAFNDLPTEVPPTGVVDDASGL